LREKREERRDGEKSCKILASSCKWGVISCELRVSRREKSEEMEREERREELQDVSCLPAGR
jgi:predicted amidophosphoribosyltransferase